MGPSAGRENRKKSRRPPCITPRTNRNLRPGQSCASTAASRRCSFNTVVSGRPQETRTLKTRTRLMTAKELLDTYYQGLMKKSGWEPLIADDFIFLGGRN